MHLLGIARNINKCKMNITGLAAHTQITVKSTALIKAGRAIWSLSDTCVCNFMNLREIILNIGSNLILV